MNSSNMDDDAEYFLPSEIARLVYGHLTSTNCDTLSEAFLTTSPHMQECRELRSRNRSFQTDANGLKLQEILDQFLNMNKLISAAARKLPGSKTFTSPVEALKCILQLDEGNGNGTQHFFLNTTEPPNQSLNIIDNHSENLSAPEHNNSSGDESSSNISLTINTPIKRTPKTPLKSNELIEISENSNSTTLDMTKNRSKSAQRRSTRLESKKNRRRNSECVKELRKNENVATPSAKPSYSDTKVQTYKKSISLSSETDSECEITNIEYYANSSPELRETRNFIFSPQTKTIPPKKTIKTMKPKKTPPAENHVSKTNKRNRPYPIVTSPGLIAAEKANKKTKLLPVLNDKEPISETENVLDVSTMRNYHYEESPQKPVEPTKTSKRRSGSSLELENSDRSCTQTKCAVDVSIIKEKLENDTRFLSRFANTINKHINSPQKKNYSSCSEELDKAIEKVLQEKETNQLIDDLLEDLGLNCQEPKEDDITQEHNIFSQVDAPGGTNPDINIITSENIVSEFTETNIDATETMISEHTDHASNAIIIKIPQEYHCTDNKENHATNDHTVEKTYIAESIGSYVSCPTDIMSPEKLQNDEESISLYSVESGELVQSVNVSEANTIIVDSNNMIIPVSKAVPLFQLYSGHTAVGQGLRSRSKYVPIAPRPIAGTVDVAVVDTVNTSKARKRNTRTKKT